MNDIEVIEAAINKLNDDKHYLEASRAICKKYELDATDTLIEINRRISSHKKKIRTVRKNCKHENTHKEYHNKCICNECGMTVY